MKKSIKIVLSALALIFSISATSCNYVDELSLAGYSYELIGIATAEDGIDTVQFSTNPTSSILKFEKDGSTFTWTFAGQTFTGTYSVRQSNKEINLNVTTNPGQFSGNIPFYYERGAAVLRAYFDELDDDFTANDVTYPEKEGPYEVTFRLK